MTNNIHLERKDVPVFLLGEYTGRKIQLRLTEKVYLSNGYWDGGSRSTYVAIELATQKVVPAHTALRNPPQFGGPKQTPEVILPQGVVIVEHAIFCGKDAGLTIYARPGDYQPALPAGNELTEDEQTVINYTCTYKNSYGGETNLRFKNAHQATKITPERWNTAQQNLMSKGFLSSNGAVTVKGRNARKGQVV